MPLTRHIYPIVVSPANRQLLQLLSPEKALFWFSSSDKLCPVFLFCSTYTVGRVGEKQPVLESAHTVHNIFMQVKKISDLF